FSDRNAPWTLLLKHEKGPVCLITPCTAMKKEKGFGFVLSAMELDELFKRREIDLGFSTGGAYSEPVSRKGMHPGGGPSGIPGAVSCRIDRNLASKAKGHGLIDAYPCLHRCLSGGGNFPTSKLDIVKSRGEWLQHLWEVAK
ncbi:MAG: hypothetical protein PHU53_06710, partial [Thermoplasmata archaeon]|nr:hypothetical protein [Thermoplasmata archaeon]